MWQARQTSTEAGGHGDTRVARLPSAPTQYKWAQPTATATHLRLLGIRPGHQEPQLWIRFRTKAKTKGPHRVCFLKPRAAHQLLPLTRRQGSPWVGAVQGTCSAHPLGLSQARGWGPHVVLACPHGGAVIPLCRSRPPHVCSGGPAGRHALILSALDLQSPRELAVSTRGWPGPQSAPEACAHAGPLLSTPGAPLPPLRPSLQDPVLCQPLC